ncbi:MAG TPA: hypothetical protein PLI77_03775 [Bacteroidales bacterium]|nr:hypothetical protein [Bacteroidales bacterium]
MKRCLYFLLLLITLTLLSCKNKQEVNPVEEKSKVQSELIDSYLKADSLYKQGIIDVDVMSVFVTHAEQFADLFPEEQIAPEYLFKAGVLTMTLARASNQKEEIAQYANKSLEIFNQIQKVYPDYEGVKNCIFYRGTTYDDILHDYKSAEIEFRDYIHKYPQDSISQILKVYLVNGLGKSPDEIAADIMKKKR